MRTRSTAVSFGDCGWTHRPTKLDAPTCACQVAVIVDVRLNVDDRPRRSSGECGVQGLGDHGDPGRVDEGQPLEHEGDGETVREHCIEHSGHVRAVSIGDVADQPDLECVLPSGHDDSAPVRDEGDRRGDRKDRRVHIRRCTPIVATRRGNAAVVPRQGRLDSHDGHIVRPSLGVTPQPEAEGALGTRRAIDQWITSQEVPDERRRA